MGTPFKMKGWSPFHQEEKKKGKKEKTKKDRPAYIKNDPALTRYKDAMDAWEAAGSPPGKQPNINDYVTP